MKTHKKKIGVLLAKARKKSGLTQLQVSQHLGFTTAQQVSNIERDAAPVPFDTVVKLCKLYKLNKKQVIDAMLEDYKTRLNVEFKKGGAA
tara:strand:+ start:45196 stop:45465 length:270 start_codon:yes stop_codon:yes gene_type:complete